MIINCKNKNFIISGPTAIGKSDIANKIAKIIGFTTINFDSQQIYKGFEFIRRTDKISELSSILHENQKINAKIFEDKLLKVINKINKFILIGGNFFYLKYLLTDKYTCFIKKKHIEIASKTLKTNNIHKLRSFARDNFYKPELVESKLKDNVSVVFILLPKNMDSFRVNVRQKSKIAVDKILKSGEFDENQKKVKTSIGYKPILSFLNNQIKRKALDYIFFKETYEYAKYQIKFANQLIKKINCVKFEIIYVENENQAIRDILSKILS